MEGASEEPMLEELFLVTELMLQGFDPQSRQLGSLRKSDLDFAPSSAFVEFVVKVPTTTAPVPANFSG